MTTRKTTSGERAWSLPSRRRAAGLLAMTFLVGAGLGCDALQWADSRGGAGAQGDFNSPSQAPQDGSSESTADTAAEQLARDIEEADIVKIAGDKLYALNTYKGLLVVDVANPDAPELVGELDLRGRAVEMYVNGAQAYIVLSADYYYPYLLGAAEPGAQTIRADGPMPQAPDFEGSKLAIVDLADPTAPSLQGKINLVGYASESRRVGSVIYVIGSNYVPWGFDRPAGQSTDEGFIASVNVADPSNIIPVERKTISGNALVMHTSAAGLFAASQVWDDDTGGTNTLIQAVDISDPAGTIALRGTVEVPGTIRNRFYLDAYENALRIVTDSWGFGFRQIRVFTYSLADLNNITALGQANIIQDESLEAVRFDGPRGYAVTFFRTDPLFVLDLRDPAQPIVTGQLEVPGFSTHIEPRGNRLIAVGVDDTDGTRPAVAYYNVEDPENPSQLGRVVLGPPGSFTESDATYDEKAFKIVDQLGLIVIPFKHVEWTGGSEVPLSGGISSDSTTGAPEGYTCLNAVQLVDFSDTGLAQRGWFEHRGRVQRVGVIGPRVFALSQVALQTVDITDRDNPVKAGQADFFSEDDMPFYADDCGWYDYWPDVIDLPSNGTVNPMQFLINIFVNGNLCGTVSVLPGAAMAAGLLLLSATGLGRRRR